MKLFAGVRCDTKFDSDGGDANFPPSMNDMARWSVQRMTSIVSESSHQTVHGLAELFSSFMTQQYTWDSIKRRHLEGKEPMPYHLSRLKCLGKVTLHIIGAKSAETPASSDGIKIESSTRGASPVGVPTINVEMTFQIHFWNKALECISPSSCDLLNRVLLPFMHTGDLELVPTSDTTPDMEEATAMVRSSK